MYSSACSPPDSSPARPILLIVIAAVPAFVSVTFWAALAEPTVVDAKVRLAGLTDASGAGVAGAPNRVRMFDVIF